MEKVKPLTGKQKQILKEFFERSVAGETMEEVASSHGISRKTLSTWKNSKEGKELHANFRKELSANDLEIFYEVLKEKMAAGSFKHMELYAKIHRDKIGLIDKQEILNTTDSDNRVKSGFSSEDISELEALVNDELPLQRVK